MPPDPPTAYEACGHLMFSLHVAALNGTDQESSADHLRVRIEPFWALLTDSERERIERLSEFLETLE